MGTTNIIVLALCLTCFTLSPEAAISDYKLNEKEFEEIFNLDPVEDPEEYKRREEALEKNEDSIKDTNEKYIAGEIDWFDAINEFADLPEDEFIKEKTGLVDNFTIGGLLQPLPEERVDEESERYFDQFEASRQNAPVNYSSVEAGTAHTYI